MEETEETITIELPIDLFGCAGHPAPTIERVRRISLRTASQVRRALALGEPGCWAQVAKLYPRWQNVIDIDTGAPSEKQPEDDEFAFYGLDQSAATWLMSEGINNYPKAG